MSKEDRKQQAKIEEEFRKKISDLETALQNTKIESEKWRSSCQESRRNAGFLLEVLTKNFSLGVDLVPKEKGVSMTKAREWWIDKEEKDDSDDIRFGSAYEIHPAQGPLHWQSSLIHVVEASRLREAEAMFKMKQDDWIEACQECDKLREENERLRAALKEITECAHDSTCTFVLMRETTSMKRWDDDESMCDCHRGIARAALGSGEKGER